MSKIRLLDFSELQLIMIKKERKLGIIFQKISPTSALKNTARVQYNMIVLIMEIYIFGRQNVTRTFHCNSFAFVFIEGKLTILNHLKHTAVISLPWDIFCH